MKERVLSALQSQVIPGGKDLHKIEVTIKTLILGDFGAAAAMISFGALLGKCNLQQLFFLVFWEMFFWGLNESLGAGSFKATDMGGSMFVHAFGAYYGLAASYFFQPNRSAQSKNAQSNYQSNTIALIGSIFLWMYWPAFNGALATGVTQQRVCAGCSTSMLTVLHSPSCIVPSLNTLHHPPQLPLAIPSPYPRPTLTLLTIPSPLQEIGVGFGSMGG